MSNNAIQLIKKLQSIEPSNSKIPRNNNRSSRKGRDNQERISFQPNILPIELISQLNCSHGTSQFSLQRRKIAQRFNKSENKISNTIYEKTTTRSLILSTSTINVTFNPILQRRMPKNLFDHRNMRIMNIDFENFENSKVSNGNGRDFPSVVSSQRSIGND
jgi:hypothetical protein